MKVLLKTIGIIAMAAIIGFTMTACPDGGGGGGGPIPLTENQWKEGTISKADGSIEYTFVAEFGKMYRVWWNDGGQGDLTYTGDIKVSAYKSGGEPIDNFTDIDSAWGTAKTYTPPFSLDPDVITRKETISLRVELKDNDVANAGKFAIVYSTGTTKPPNFPSSGIIPLTENQWKDGSITNANGADWYSLSVTSGTEYKFWWNERNPNGNYSKSADVTVSAYYSNGTAVFADRPTAWATPVSFTAASSGTVYVKVTPASSGTGTYGIVYSTGSDKPVVPFNVPATPLTEFKWEEGNLPNTNDMDWYSLFVTDGTTYNLWWNERGSNGDNTKTADVSVNVYKSDATAITISNSTTAWATASSFTADSTGTVYIRVMVASSAYTGTYGIVYSTKTPRPVILPANITALNANEWKDGNITANGEDWYSFSATETTTYNLWWNETGNNGNGTKLANIIVSAWYKDGAVISTNQDTAWATPVSFTATSTSTVYVRVTPSSNSSIGAYGIVYSTANTRPAATINVAAVPLTELKWEEGNLPNINSMNWYSLSVTYGTTYRLWWNERGGSTYGDGTKTADVSVNVYKSDGTSISITNSTTAWSTASSFTADSTGTVYIRVMLASSTYTGSYGIVYTTKTDRPLILPATITALTANVWKDGNIAANGEDWYSFSATDGTTYRFWWNETGNNGYGNKSANIRVSAWYSDGTLISVLNNQDTAWATAVSFTAASTGTVYVRVTPSSNSSIGTYGIVYNTGTTTPRPLDLPGNIIPLTADKWTDGIFNAITDVVWYSFPVTQGNMCLIWLDQDPEWGSFYKSARVYMSIYCSDGTELLANGYRNFWQSMFYHTPEKNDTLYIRITPYSSDYLGNKGYGIVYNIGGQRPAVPIVVR
ncbi:MAG: hypothetical protein LBI28_03295 [Treponema sp.]|jgi:hypothetical protein|nr:hypothetical protein [Treponema sp.]